MKGKTKKDQLKVLDYAGGLVKADIQYDLLTPILKESFGTKYEKNDYRLVILHQIDQIKRSMETDLKEANTVDEKESAAQLEGRKEKRC